MIDPIATLPHALPTRSRRARSLADVEVLHFDELCGLLDPAADFEPQAARLVRRLEQYGIRIDVAFVRQPARTRSRRESGLLGVYRAEVQRIPVMDRPQEVRFCMGLELLWRRLQRARRSAGLPAGEVERWPGTGEGPDPEARLARRGGLRKIEDAVQTESASERLLHRHQEFVAVRNELLERNLHIVFRLLERYRAVGVAPEDMVQEANRSLFKAIENFDFRRSVRFKTYATYWVNQAFLNAIYNQSRVVRVPAYIQKAMKKIRDTAAALGTRLDDPEAISVESGVPADLVRSAMVGNRYTLSLDQSLHDSDGGSSMADMVVAEVGEEPAGPREEQVHMLQALGDAVLRLSLREQTVLKLRFGLDGGQAHTLSSVGEQLQISLERVRQIQKGALDKMRSGATGELLAQFA